MAEIIKISAMADALRNTGYKNIESAMAEIIDNSVQWYAKNVLVIVTEDLSEITGRKHIKEIAFLDNGCGMDDETLGGCLAFGYTQNQNRKGMGRFGVGLPQSSMYACPRVEVYSWTEKSYGAQDSKKVYLDMNEVKKEIETEIAAPIREDIPLEYQKYITYKYEENNEEKTISFNEHGTLVIWRNCDRVNPKTVPFLFDKLEFELGKRFRYFINDGTSSIRLVSQNDIRDVKPNDPLLLLENNVVLGDELRPGELIAPYGRATSDINLFKSPLFEPYTNEQYPDGIIDYPVKYNNPETGEIETGSVRIRFSRIKQEFYDQTALSNDPGNTDMGKWVKRLEGISVVRANREIDFGRFDFYDATNEPTHRWWGCEISFDPYLDEAFGVANNKQHVELKELSVLDYEDDEVKPMWIQLNDIIRSTISEIVKENKLLRRNSRKANDLSLPSTEIINAAEEKREDKDEGKTSEQKQLIPEEERQEQTRRELINEGIEKPSIEDIENYMNNKVNISYVNQSRMGPLFDYSFSLGFAKLTINIEHPFFTTVMSKVYENAEFKSSFELLFASFVKAMDVTKGIQQDQNDRLLSKWNERLTAYILEQYNKN